MFYEFAGMMLDPVARELRRDGEIIALEPLAIELLAYLIQHQGRVVSRRALVDEVWQGAHVSDSAISRAVSLARRAVGDDDARMIETIRGKGFRFAAPATRAAPGGDAELFVGREAALGGIVRDLDAIAGGAPGRVVLISGEPGIGKTRLLEEFRELAVLRGAHVWFGRCNEAARTSPYLPWHEVLGAGIEAVPSGLISPEAAPAILEAMPELGAQLPGARPPESAPGDSGQGRFRLAARVASALRGLRGSALAVVGLDDLTRADHASLTLFQDLAERAGDLPVILLGTYRDTERHPDPECAEILVQLARTPRARPLQLTGLQLDDVVALARSVAQRPVSAEQADTLLRRTAGNPFFLHQLLRTPDALDASAQALPAVSRASILEHLAGVSGACRAMLEFAALIGRQVDIDLLSTATDTSLSSLDVLLREAGDARVIEAISGATRRFRFVHALIAETLAAEMPAASRRARHRRIAEALVRGGRGERAIDIAHHFFEGAEPGQSRAAIDHASRAARNAARRHAYGDAAGYLDRALSLLRGEGGGETRERLEMMFELGELRMRAHQVTEGRPVLEQVAQEALERGEVLLSARAALAYAGEEFPPEADEKIVALVESVLAAKGSIPPALRARLLAASESLWYFVDDDKAERRAREAVRLAREAGDRAALCDALSATSHAIGIPTRAAERDAVSREQLEVALELGDVQRVCVARHRRISNLLEAGDLAGVEAEVSAHTRLAAQRPDLLMELHTAHLEALVHLLHGRVAEASKETQRGWELGRHVGYAIRVHWYTIQLFANGHAASGLAASRPFFQQLVSENGHLGWRLADAFAGLELGEVTRPREVLEQAVAGGQIQNRFDFTWLATTGLTLDLAHALGDDAAELVCVEALRPFADRRASMQGVADFGPIGPRLERHRRHDLGRAHAPTDLPASPKIH